MPIHRRGFLRTRLVTLIVCDNEGNRYTLDSVKAFRRKEIEETARRIADFCSVPLLGSDPSSEQASG